MNRALETLEFWACQGLIWLLSSYFQQWENEFLTWNASNYGDVSRIHFAPEEIWVPDIALFNKWEYTTYKAEMVLTLFI